MRDPAIFVDGGSKFPVGKVGEKSRQVAGSIALSRAPRLPHHDSFFRRREELLAAAISD